MVRLLVSVLLAMLVPLAACSRGGDSIVVYVSADEAVARPILAKFSEETGIRVLPKFDTEATKTTGLAAVLRSERDKPRADAFWSSEVFVTAQLASEGVLAPHRSQEADAWPAPFRERDGRWFGFASRARVVAYAPSRVAEHERPVAWVDLGRDWWKGRIAMADPRFGTTRGHMGALRVWWDRNVVPGYFDAWSTGLAEKEIRLLITGNAGVVEAIVAGEVDAGMTDSDDVWAAQANGADLAIVYPRFDVDQSNPAGGTLLIPNTVGIVEGAPHPALAAKFVDFMLSPVVERMLLESVSHNIPVRPERLPAEVQPLVEKYRVSGPVVVDFAKVAAEMDSAVETLMRHVTP